MIRVLLVALVLVAAAYDWKYRIIPNWLTIAGVAAGFVVNFFASGISGLWLAFTGMAFALLIYVPMYALHAMGAGDAKLMAGVGAMVGPFWWGGIFVYTALIGGVIALVTIFAGGRSRQTFRNIGTILMSLIRGLRPWEQSPDLDVRNPRSLRLPHAVSIAAGTLAYLIFGPIR